LQPRNRLIISILIGLVLLTFIVTTITFGVLWNRAKSRSNYAYAVERGTIGFPVRLPNDGEYVQ
jgi:hypothetical protein